jgi:hypothetical protein
MRNMPHSGVPSAVPGVFDGSDELTTVFQPVRDDRLQFPTLTRWLDRWGDVNDGLNVGVGDCVHDLTLNDERFIAEGGVLDVSVTGHRYCWCPSGRGLGIGPRSDPPWNKAQGKAGCNGRTGHKRLGSKP